MRIQWNVVTWYSKLLAVLILFVVVPILAFVLGKQYGVALGEVQRYESIVEVPAKHHTNPDTLGWNTGNPAADFTYNGKPMYPECVTNLVMGDSSTTDSVLSSCTREGATNKVETIADETGSTYTGVDLGSNGFSRYYVIGEKDGTFWLYGIASGGGSGVFTSILSVQKSGDTLKLLDSIAGGDRCNGGIADVPKIINGVVTYGINMTPSDIINTAANKNIVKPYNDLESSAASCFGTGVYHHDVVGKQNILDAITLNTDATNSSDPTGNYTYQTCYNKLQNEYVTAGHGKLVGKDITAFAQAFTNRCMHDAPAVSNPSTQ